MKDRPRKAENRIADELNLWFQRYNLSPIKRIPVLGREGPDFTQNELKLNLDAKSRKSNPKSHQITTSEIRYAHLSHSFAHHYWCVRLRELDLLMTVQFIHAPKLKIKKSIVITRWLKKMEPGGGIILHWPGTDYKNAVLVVSTDTVLNIREEIHAS